QELEQPTNLVILTSFVFNNTRLMLLSGIGKPYDPASSTGVIGRNYAYQTTGTVNLFYENKLLNGFMGGGGRGMIVDEFNGDNFDHAGLSFFGGSTLTVVNFGMPPIRSHPVPSGTPRWGSSWKKAVAQYYNRSL